VSPLQESLLISGSIFLVVVASSLGRKEYRVNRFARPLVISAIFGYEYLKGAPTSTAALIAYAVALAIGLGFGLLSTAFTRIERDSVTGKIMTITGVGFIATWLVAMGMRVVFIALAEDNQAFRMHLGRFLYDHSLPEAAIAPFFVLMALTTVLSRIGFAALRAGRLPAAAAAPVLAERPTIAA
jgi:hypothetical protein